MNFLQDHKMYQKIQRQIAAGVWSSSNSLPSKDDRFNILKTICRKVPIGQDVDLVKVAYDQHCEGYSGADLSALVREAQLSALKASMV